MRKRLAYILSAFYLVFSLGMTLEIDKCCLVIASICGLELSHDDCKSHSKTCCSAKKSCDHENKKDGHKDCDKVQLNLTLEDEHRTPSMLSFNWVRIQIKIELPKASKSFYSQKDKILFIPKEKVPPEPHPLYLMNSSLTFYA